MTKRKNEINMALRKGDNLGAKEEKAWIYFSFNCLSIFYNDGHVFYSFMAASMGAEIGI